MINYARVTKLLGLPRGNSPLRLFEDKSIVVMPAMRFAPHASGIVPESLHTQRDV